jgi:glycosyltransferase involved in cell wall biosynthesis
MSEILLVSKPVAPPWTDGSKSLVRDLAQAMTRHDPVVLTTPGASLQLPRGRVERVYAEGNDARWSGQGALRVVARLASGPRADLWHFVFAPNPRASHAARALARLRRVPTVQMAASAPRPGEDLAAVLFGDRVIALSRGTAERFEPFAPGRVRCIAPAVAPLEPLDASQRERARRRLGLPLSAPVVVFPGDIEQGRGAQLAIETLAQLPRELGAILVMACRRKTATAAEQERAMRALSAQLGVEHDVRWIGETPHVHALLGASDAVILPTSDLFAKVDVPIVLLEAAWLARPIFVAQGTPAADLAARSAAVALPLDATAWADAVGRVLDRSDEAHARGEAARAAASYYRPERMADEVERVYEELLA